MLGGDNARVVGADGVGVAAAFGTERLAEGEGFEPAMEPVAAVSERRSTAGDLVTERTRVGEGHDANLLA